jgi:hypothetical protein
MSGTARTPIARRAAQPQVTARAIEIFERLERARQSRRRRNCSVSDYSGYCEADCAACRAWFGLHDQLHRELRLKPWFWPCLPRNPYPPASDGARAWKADVEQAALWKLLHDAAVGAAHATEPV